MSSNVKFYNGDLFDFCKQGYFDLIVHGCNCYHTMGSGIAGKLNKLTNGAVIEPDKKTPYGDINKLGTYSILYDWTFDNHHSVDVYNLYTQHKYGGPGVHVHWQSFYTGLFSICQENRRSSIGLPLIGCGLAGGEKDDFVDRVFSIAQFFTDIDFYIVEL